ncbi:MAG: hypothetical protein GX062_00365 [Firmicutes bacterium]|nr:hypothetical protein [Bacillota bacterium]
MALSALLFIPFLAVVVILVLIAGSRVGSEGGGEEMIKNIYVYLVLFATLMMTIGGSVGIFMAAADIVAPTPYYQSFEEYRNMVIDRRPVGTEDIEQETPSEAELRARYEAMVASHKETQVARATNSLIKSFGWVVVPLPVFIYFQRRLSKTSQGAP